MNTYMTFYWEWLQLDKKDFRILAMLADKGIFTGTLMDVLTHYKRFQKKRKLYSPAVGQNPSSITNTHPNP